MTCDTTPIFPHGSRERRFPYMSASTYFPLQHQCWLKSSLHPTCCSGSHALSWDWDQTYAVTHQPDWLLIASAEYLLSRRAWLHWGWPRFPFVSLPGPGLTGLALRRLPPSILKSWGSRVWSCLPLVWSSSCSWQFSSSLASWSPCPHLKVRANRRPHIWLTGCYCDLERGWAFDDTVGDTVVNLTV